jgi:hypothetical protein
MGLPVVQPAIINVTHVTPTRMQALKDAAQVIVGSGGVIDTYAITNDKLGLVFFSSKASPDARALPTPCGTTGSNLLAADDPSNVGAPTNPNSFSSQIQTQNPTLATSIGAGLRSANTCGFARDVPGNTHKTILLFSDGEQNTAPLVSLSPSSTHC